MKKARGQWHCTVLRHGVEHGFTLIEMLVTMAIMAILLAIAVPSFHDASLNSKLNGIANGFVASAQLARSEAIKRNAAVTLCASSNGNDCSDDWSDGWIVFWHDDVADKPVILARQGGLTKGFVLSGDQTSIVFQPTGVGATISKLTACRATPSVGSIGRLVEVSGTGRTEVTKIDISSCP